MKTRAILIAGLLCAAAARGQDDLPKRGSGASLDFEPKLMLDGPHAESVTVESAVPASPENMVAQKQATLAQAERRAVDSEQLVKQGILAQVEAEERMMRVVQARKELADAVLAAAIANADAVKKSLDAHKAPQSDLDAAMKTVDADRQSVASASAEWATAQMDEARLDLKRKRKLYAEGVATRHELEIAEDRVAYLTGTAAK